MQTEDLIRRSAVFHRKAVDSWDSTYLVVNQRGQGEVVEEIREKLPDVGISVLSQALVVESVHLGDLSRLVVASQDGDPVPISQFERDEQRDRLYRVVSSIDVIAHEQVIRVGRVSTDPEQLRQVVLRCLSVQSTKVLRATHELTVYVSTNGHGASDGLHIRLLHQHFSCLQRDRLSARISDNDVDHKTGAKLQDWPIS